MGQRCLFASIGASKKYQLIAANGSVRPSSSTNTITGESKRACKGRLSSAWMT
jgi:hypothetical protein